MKPLRPLVILIAGPVLLGAVCAAAGAIWFPGERELRDVLFYFAAGAATGLICFGAIAAGLAFRNIARRLLGDEVPLLYIREMPNLFERFVRFVRQG